MNKPKDITPEGSVAPVMLDTSPREPVNDVGIEPEIPRDQRAEAYRQEADPLFFKVQRGEATEQEWLDKVQQIRERYPYPENNEGEK